MLVIYSDPHLGLVRSTNTTPASRKSLQQDLFAAVRGIHDKYQGAFKVCAGDFFDTYSNEEAIVSQAAPLFYDLDLCLSGNHDVVNREGKVGSLELLSELGHGSGAFIVVQAEYGSIYVNRCTTADAELFAVPHVATADLFEQALELAESKAAAAKQETSYSAIKKPSILLLHCNYDNELAAEKEATLNLSRLRASQLLETFDFVMIGHVHQPSSDFDGRLIMLGNVHPTGFGDLGDKYITLVDNGEVWHEPVYLAEEHEAQLDINDYLSERYAPLPERVRFLELTGHLAVEQANLLGRTLTELREQLPELRCLRSKVEFAAPEAIAKEQSVQTHRLPEIIEAELQSRPDQLAIWNETTGKETQNA